MPPPPEPSTPSPRTAHHRGARSHPRRLIVVVPAASVLVLLALVVQRLASTDNRAGGFVLRSNNSNSNRGIPARGSNPRLSDPLRYLNATLVPAHPPLTPALSCQRGGSSTRQQPRNNNKLVFVHVLKTAGTTLRAFFAEFAARCGVGWVEVQCSAPDGRTIGPRGTSTDGGGRGAAAAVWKSRAARNPCVQKSYVLRSGEYKRKTTDISNHFVAAQFDIMGGHLPIGTGRVWNTTAGGGDVGSVGAGVRYLSFFRNAAMKYVSGEAFWKPQVTKAELVQETKDKVRRAVGRGEYHSKYGIYLLTPAQREGGYAGDAKNKKEDVDDNNNNNDHPPTPPAAVDEVAVEVMLNLMEYGVVAGITERMSESMELVRRLVDDGGDAEGIFEKFGLKKTDEAGEKSGGGDNDGAEEKQDSSAGGGSSSSSSAGGMKINPSKLSSSDVMAELVEDVAFMEKLLECVKYEQQITDFALAVHLRQYASLKSNG